MSATTGIVTGDGLLRSSKNATASGSIISWPNKRSASLPAIRSPGVSAMEFQAIDDLVDHLAFGAHGNANEIEISASDRPHHLAIGGVMRGPEHVFGVDGRRHVARQRPFERAGKRRAVGAIDQDRLS